MKELLPKLQFKLLDLAQLWVMLEAGAWKLVEDPPAVMLPVRSSIETHFMKYFLVVLCKPNYITSRLEDQVVYVMEEDGSKKDFWLKSHPMYPDLDYPNNLNCYVSFKTRYKPHTQYLKFEVVSGSLSGDAYLAFGNDYGDLER